MINNIKDICINDITVNGMIKIGTTGNIYKYMKNVYIKNKIAFERNIKIDYIYVEFKDDMKVFKLLIKTDISRCSVSRNKFGVVYNEDICIKYKKSNGEEKAKIFRIAARINLDTGNYCIMDDVTNCLKYLHFKLS